MKPENNDILDLFKDLAAIQKKAVDDSLPYLTSEVQSIINKKLTDKNRIEHLLDNLLDLAYDNDILLLMKRLFRYYFEIDNEATIYYIQSYRELWDENEMKEEF